MEPVRIGIIGCGVIGRHHVKAGVKSDAVELVAVADVVRERAEEVARANGIPHVFTNASDLIAHPDVEAVVLAMPAGVRFPLALEAFQQGKHVLVEKPVALNAAQVEAMIAAKGDRVGACCSCRFRFYSSARAAEDVIRSGALGPLRTIHCRGISPAGPPPSAPPPSWRLSRAQNGGGILTNWGCYDLDYVLGITGWTLEPREVFAATWPVPAPLTSYVAPGSDAETHVVALIRCASGAVIHLERAEYAIAPKAQVWQIIGEYGSLELQMTPGTGGQNRHYTLTRGTGTTSGVLWQGEESWDLSHALPIHDFALSIRNGTPPKTTLEQALIVQKITDAIYRSAAEGGAVAIA